MRGVSRWASRVTPLLAVFLVLTAAGAWADEPPTPPTDPPGARMQPPGGLTAQARMKPPDGVTTQSRIQPPVGIAPAPSDPPAQARLNPPGGTPMTLAQMFLLWLQSRISIPPG